MNCAETQGLLSDYIDDELAAGPRGHVEAHLAGCDGCTSEHRALRRTVRFVQGNGGRLPDTSGPGEVYASFTRAIVDEAYGVRPEQVIVKALLGPEERTS